MRSCCGSKLATHHALTMGGLHDVRGHRQNQGWMHVASIALSSSPRATAILVNSQSVPCEHGQMERLWSQANGKDGKGESQWLIRVTTPCPLA